MVGFDFMDSTNFLQTLAAPLANVSEIWQQAQDGLDAYVGTFAAARRKMQPNRMVTYFIEFKWSGLNWM